MNYYKVYFEYNGKTHECCFESHTPYTKNDLGLEHGAYSTIQSYIKQNKIKGSCPINIIVKEGSEILLSLSSFKELQEFIELSVKNKEGKK